MRSFKTTEAAHNCRYFLKLLAAIKIDEKVFLYNIYER